MTGAAAPRRPGGLLDAVEPVTAAVFRTAARLRGDRAFHPRGRAFAAEVVLDPASAPPGFPTGRYRGIVRFSRGAGLPDAVPDVLGIGVRVVDAGGLHVHQDLLMASAGWSVVGRRLLRPGRSFTAGVLSTILPYEVGGRRVLIGARVPGDRPLRLADVDLLAAARRPVELLWSAPGGAWWALGEVRPDAPLDDEAGRRLGLDPFRTVPGVEPVGLLNALRRPAYGASRAGRDGDPAGGAGRRRRDRGGGEGVADRETAGDRPRSGAGR